MLEKSKLARMLGAGMILVTTLGYPSLGYETSRQDFVPQVQQEIVVEEKAPIRIDGEYLEQRIIENNLDTGRFSPGEAVKIVEEVTKKGQTLPKYLDEGIVYSVVTNESGWDPNAESDRGAKGLFQLIEDTWNTYNPRVGYDKVGDFKESSKVVRRLFNDNEKYFRETHPDWNKLTEKEKIEIHLAAYNCGARKVASAGWSLEKKRKGVPSETRKYVERVLETYDSLLSEKT